MSDTPRTDAAEAQWDRDGGGSVTRLFSFARTLERELAAKGNAAALVAFEAGKRYGALRAAGDKLRDALEALTAEAYLTARNSHWVRGSQSKEDFLKEWEHADPENFAFWKAAKAALAAYADQT